MRAHQGIAHPVDLEVLVPHLPDLAFQRPLSLQARRNTAGLDLSGLMLVASGLSHRQLRADRLVPVLLVIGVDERHHHFFRQSRSGVCYDTGYRTLA